MKMKKVLRALAALFAGTMVCALAACSDASDNYFYAGTVSFCVDKQITQKAYEIARGISKDEPNDPALSGVPAIRFEISLNGEYSATQTKNINYNLNTGDPDGTGGGNNQMFESFSVDFMDVPVGKMIYAKIRAYEIGNSDFPDGDRRVLLVGKSNTIQVASGNNPLSVSAYNATYSIPVQITIQLEEGFNISSLSTLNNRYVYAVDPFSKTAKKLMAAKDDVERYEICNNMEEFSSDIVGQLDLKCAEWGYDPSVCNCVIDSDAFTMTVTDNMSLPVSEDDPSSKGSSVYFVLSCQQYDSVAGTSKTKCYGISSTVAPVKKPEGSNNIAFGAKAINVVDTSYALYNISSGQYNYYLRSDPSADLSGDGDIQSDGTSGSSGTYRQSSCFDADGNFYTLSITPSITPEERSVYIRSNNPKITSSGASTGTYECKNGSGEWMTFDSIACDIKRNELFALMNKYSKNILFGTGNFIESGTNAQIAYVLNSSSGMNVERSFFSVYDGKAYFLAKDGEGKHYIIKADLSKKKTTALSYGRETWEVDTEVATGIPVPSDAAKITDMLYQDGAVYLLARDYALGSQYSYGYEVIFGSSTTVKSRGALIKCDVSTGATKTLGWSDASLPVARNKFYAYNSKGAGGEFCTANEYKKENFLTYEVSSDNLPRIYSPASTSSAFYGPQKFIAIKPKKLVIADDGLAFYTDSVTGAWHCKNSNRVVTVDLESFAISSSDSSASFDGDETGGVFSNQYLDAAYVTPVDLYYGGETLPYHSSAGGTVSLYVGIPLDEE